MAEPESVLLVRGPSAGGIRNHVATLADGLRDRGWRVRIADPDGGRALDQRGVDVVHAHGLRMGWLASLVPRRKPLVVTVHNVVLDDIAGRASAWQRRLEAALPRRVDAVIATSADVAARLGDGAVVIPPVGPAPVVRHGRAAVRAALHVPEGTPLVVVAARLHRQKGLDTLLDAAPRLVGTRIVVVGEGPQEERLRSRIHDEGLADVVRLAGPSANAGDELAAADVVAVPSIWESGPLVLAEAMELGRPVVSTPVGFAPELVEDGVTGRLVPIGDAGALAGAIEAMLADAAAAARMAAAGQQRVEAWLDRDGAIDEVIDVYRSAVAGR
jgi:glycosyltransferase involved in cell wall biosynthesis